MATRTYTIKLPASPTEAGIGYIVGTQIGYEAPIIRTPAIGGTINTPIVARGQASVTYLSKTTPAAGAIPLDMVDLSLQAITIGNITIDKDAALTGGNIGVQEFGDGSRSVTYQAIYTFFAQAVAA